MAERVVAERVGFELTVAIDHTAFRERPPRRSEYGFRQHPDGAGRGVVRQVAEDGAKRGRISLPDRCLWKAGRRSRHLQVAALDLTQPSGLHVVHEAADVVATRNERARLEASDRLTGRPRRAGARPMLPRGAWAERRARRTNVRYTALGLVLAGAMHREVRKSETMSAPPTIQSIDRVPTAT